MALPPRRCWFRRCMSLILRWEGRRWREKSKLTSWSKSNDSDLAIEGDLTQLLAHDCQNLVRTAATAAGSNQRECDRMKTVLRDKCHRALNRTTDRCLG